MNKFCAVVFSLTYIIIICAAEVPDCTSQPDGTMFPDFERCQFFYICLDGETFNKQCPLEMFFDIEINNCNIGECSDSGEDPEQPITTTRDPTIEEGIKCPPSNNLPELIFIPSGEVCERYFICVNGQPIRQLCRDGLYFNPEINKCDFPENVDCEFSKTENSTTTPEHPEDENGFPICPNVGHSFFPHPNNCDLYFSCFMGFRSVQQCPFHHHWDIRTNRCRVLEQAICHATRQ